MIYEFIIDNSRSDKNEVFDDLNKKIEAYNLTTLSRFYFAKDRADAERHVRMSVFLRQKEEICFVACGDLTGQVAAGLVNAQSNKSMAILDYNITEDFLKSFPERDFKDFSKLMEGEEFYCDMIKLNDDYSLNVITVGISAMMAKISREYSAIGLANDKYRKKALLKALLRYRFTRAHITADGKSLNGKYLLHMHIANGQWCGSKYHNSPDAILNDGYLDVGIILCGLLKDFSKAAKMLFTGEYKSTSYGRRKSVLCRAKHIEIDAPHLLYVSYDGEIYASRHYSIDVIPNAVKIILPKK